MCDSFTKKNALKGIVCLKENCKNIIQSQVLQIEIN